MGNTTKFYSRHNGAWQNPSTRYAHHNGAYQAILGRYAHHNGSWQMTYSTPSVSCGNVSGSGSGAGSSGSVTSSAASPSIGGYASGSYSYSWSRVSGMAFTCSNANAASPTWSYNGFDAGDESTDSESSVWQLTVTDTATGATCTCEITVSLSWYNTTVPYGSFTTSGGGGSGSGSSSAGSARSITEDWSIQSSALTIPASGGPTSGSYSYSWSITGDTGTSASFDNASLAQPTVSGSFTIGPASTKTDTVTCSCTVTDTVSGYSYTQTGITFSYRYTNNTG